MSDGEPLTRRSVLKSTGSAVGAVGITGTIATATVAADETYEGHLKIKIPYTNADIDIRYTIEYDTCDAEVSLDIENGVWTESNHYDCSSRDSHAEFDVGFAEGSIDIEIDFASDTVYLAAEGCANYFFGETCGSASETVTF